MFCKKSILILGLILLQLSPLAAYADKGDGKDLGDKPDCVDTTLGCIPSDPHELVFSWLLPKAVILAALSAVALIVIGGFQFVGATGDMDRLAAAKSTITAAITGLLFILLSVVFLRIMGIDILGIEDWIF